MTALRRLAAVLLLVTVVAAFTVAWEHSGAASWITGESSPDSAAAKLHRAPVPHPRVRRDEIGSAWPHWSDVASLERTLIVEGGIGALVVVGDVRRRRRRRP